MWHLQPLASMVSPTSYSMVSYQWCSHSGHPGDAQTCLYIEKQWYHASHTLCNGFADSPNHLPSKTNILIPSESTQAMNEESKYLYINEISCWVHSSHWLEKPTLDQPFSINKCIIFNNSYLHDCRCEFDQIFTYCHTQVYRDVWLLCGHAFGLCGA